MGSEERKKSQCPCCKICKECTGFQKILEIQDSGVVVYRHKRRIDSHDNTDDNIDDNIFVQNTNDNKISPAYLASAFEQHQLNCTKCQQVMKHAQSLLQNVPSISEHDIISVCYHCRKKLKSLVPCFECETIVKKFVATTGKVNDEYEYTQKKNFMMFLKFQNFLKRLSTDERQLKKEKSRPYSSTIAEREPIFRPEMLRPSTGARFLAPVIRGSGKTENLIPLKPSTFPESKAQKAHKRPGDSLSIKIKETEHYSNRSMSDESLLKTEKIRKPNKTQSLQDIAEKSLKPCLLASHYDKEIKIKKEQDSHGTEPIRKDSFISTLVSDANKKILPKDFRYVFPEDVKKLKEISNIHVTSAELIKGTQDRLQMVADETKRKQEELQFARKERKRLAEEEIKRLAEEETKRIVAEEEKRLADEQNKRLTAEEYKTFAEGKSTQISEGNKKKHSDEDNEKLTQTEYKSKKISDRSKKQLTDEKSKQFDSESKRGIPKRTPVLSTSKTTVAIDKAKENMLRDKYEKLTEKEGKQPRSKDDRQKDDEEKLFREKDEKAGKLQKEKDEKQRVQQDKLAEAKDEKLTNKERSKDKEVESFAREKDNKQKGKGDKYTQGSDENQIGKEDKSIQAKDKKQKAEAGKLSNEKDGQKINDGQKYEKQRDKRGTSAEKVGIKKQKATDMSKDKIEIQNRKEDTISKGKDEKQKHGNVTGEKSDKIGDKQGKLHKETNEKQRDKDETRQDKEDNQKMKQKDKEDKSTADKELELMKNAKVNEGLATALLTKQAKAKENEAKLKKTQDEIARKAREAADKALPRATLHTFDNVAPGNSNIGQETRPGLPHSKVPGFTSQDDIHHKKDDKFIDSNRVVNVKELDIRQILVRKPSHDDFVLHLIKTKQDANMKKDKGQIRTPITDIDLELYRRHALMTMGMGNVGNLYESSDLELDIISLQRQDEEIGDIIIGEKIYRKKRVKAKMNEDGISPFLYKSEFIAEPLQDKLPAAVAVASEHNLPSRTTKSTKPNEAEAKGIIRYALSDRTYIDKGWTLLPTEKVVRKMNVYRMRPARPEFDWFENNKNKRLMQYDSGDKLAEFDDDGRGRWYYRNGRLALDYYDSEEAHAQQRFVIYSSGEPDERGRGRPITVLATFDYLGNGVVFDHAGKIRLKYNQTEGVILDRGLGPVSHWKWHSLNDPPVLQQVMIDTQLAHKDPEILHLAETVPASAEEKVRPDNEEMLAIEFDNFIKEKSKKLTQKFKPFQIKMKALKINEQFSLRVLDQATIYLLFRDGTTNLKLNLGMLLDHKEIVDTDTADMGEVSNNVERLPSRTDSIAGLQRSVAYAQRVERLRMERERRLRPPAAPCASADQLRGGASRPMRRPLVAAPSASTTTASCTCRRPPSTDLYYDTRLI